MLTLPAMNSVTGILGVALPTPLHHCFDYLPPPDCAISAIEPGMRLRVPFGRGTRVGVVVDKKAHSEVAAHRLRHALAVLDTSPLVDETMLTLLRWAADYYHHPLGEVIFGSLPTLLRTGRPAHTATRRRYRLTPQGLSADPAELSRAPRQAALLALLQRHVRGLESAALASVGGDWRRALRALGKRGWIMEEEVAAGAPEDRHDASAAKRRPHPLHRDQAEATRQICDSLGRFQACLLEGITGSGKTEVYLHIIETVVARGLQALVLVPEIGLTPQLVERFRTRLGLPLAVFHSGLSDRQRLDAWLAARAGKAPVVIGTRSAVFTPLHRPGVIIIDEEHDASFKQQEGFRYHARDIAVMRARQAAVPVVLGSATPSLESLHNARGGRYRHLRLHTRAGGASPPRMTLIDVRGSRLEHGLSPPLLEAVAEHLQARRQVLLFLNRRGYAPTLYCQQCGWIARCRRCDAHLVLHRGEDLLRCHHCDGRQAPPACCPGCGNEQTLHPLGQGTQRVEAALAERFPGTDIVRIDRDSTRRKGSLEALLGRLRDGAGQILLGTQMIAKGHHLPNITLVGILDADQGLFGADFRATERMAQLVLQVAGRAGRARHPGEVLIQSRCPEHPLFYHLLRQDYPAICDLLLEERRQGGLPPFGALALLRAEAVDTDAPRLFLEAAATRAADLGTGEVTLLGPAPAPMERRAGRHRAQLLLQSRRRPPLHRLLAALVPRLDKIPGARRVRWSLDVDPQEMF